MDERDGLMVMGGGSGAGMETVLAERETRVTILIPSTCLPSAPPKDGRAKIWGGGLPPINEQLANPYAPRLRRIYTDDSDIVMCALHSGHISWIGTQRARTGGLDLKLVLSLLRDRDVGRYIGGQGALVESMPLEDKIREGVDLNLEELLKGPTAVKNGNKENGKGKDRALILAAENEAVASMGVNLSWLMGASWGNGHDGSGIEVVSAEWISVSLFLFPSRYYLFLHGTKIFT